MKKDQSYDSYLYETCGHEAPKVEVENKRIFDTSFFEDLKKKTTD